MRLFQKRKAEAAWAKQLVDYACFVLGSAFYAFGFCYFIEPNHISPGGVTGIAAVLHVWFAAPTGLTLFLLNIPILALGFWKIGGSFIGKTLFVTVTTSLLIDLFSAVLPAFEGDRLLAAIFGGALSGLGLATVMLRGATTGGIDVIAKVLRLKFPYLTMGRLVLLLDGFVILLATFCYRDMETALFTALSIFVSSKVMDTILYGADQGRLIFIVTTNGSAMATALFQAVNRGTTVLPASGGYRGETRQMLLCAVRKQEVTRAVHTVRQTDPDAFTVVSVTGGIFGYGFEQEEA